MVIDLQNPEPYMKHHPKDPGPYGVYILLGSLLLGIIIALTV